MAFAGACWGVYSLLGRGSANPMLDTTANFLRAAPLAVVASAIGLAFAHAQISSTGLLLAIASGALSSGVGYVIWYAALRGLTATRAAVVQLVVPLLAALGGVIFLAEVFTARLAIAGILILGGVALAIATRMRQRAALLRPRPWAPVSSASSIVKNRGDCGAAPPGLVIIHWRMQNTTRVM
jgi:drug/metabolite transporter (DMT)-like permease